jgi:hypothetical protein
MAESGMAIAIFAAMAAIIVAGIALGYLLSRGLARGRGWSGTKRTITALTLSAIGIVGGALVVTATFYESTWAPPPQVLFKAPPGFAHTWVFLLEDPKSANRLEWRGMNVPFFGKSTIVELPAHGILRVQSLDGISGRVDVNAQWNAGSHSTGQGGGPAPPATGAVSMSSFNWTNGKETVEPPFMDQDALGAYIVARERGAK